MTTYPCFKPRKFRFRRVTDGETDGESDSRGRRQLLVV